MCYNHNVFKLQGIFLKLEDPSFIDYGIDTTHSTTTLPKSLEYCITDICLFVTESTTALITTVIMDFPSLAKDSCTMDTVRD